MIFESLSDKLTEAFKKLKGKGKLTEADIKAAMREIKLALLEADVNFKVVKEFISAVSEKCMGAEVLESLTPAQQVIKIVNDELTQLMGGEVARVKLKNNGPTIMLLAGLQGAGKTTHCAKLANYYKKQGHRPLLVACDIYRPAAIKQLQVLGAQLDIPVFSLGDQVSPVEIARQASEHARKHGNDVVFLDTAGRLHIDDTLMQELQDICAAVEPSEILLTIDAMTGQDAVNVAETFNQQLELTGVILTKLDGDARGGAALTVRSVTGKPIKFIGVGEKLSDIEPFYPDRMASRILGMGDVLSLIEKAQETVDMEKAKELEEKLKKNSFDFNDFLGQLQQMKNMGSVQDILGMLPGVDKKAISQANIDEKQFARIEAIILSMTEKERANPSIINSSRKRRIAAGSGTQVPEVNRLLKQFEQMQKMFKQLSGFQKGMVKRGKKKGRGGFPGLGMGGFPGLPGRRPF
ncbi:MAG: signal recognition particle protein [Eubacteriales bacterium]|jgi:signal recognition particle subunit SRP54